MNIPILGTSVDSIDLAEDRERFKKIVDKLNLLQPVMALLIQKNKLLKL
jgi:carbamoyl-phosphate synthase large subunit